MKTYLVTGAASGIGAATTELLRSYGHQVITVDRDNADIVADLGTKPGRDLVIAGVRERTQQLHGIVPAAGIAGLPHIAPETLISINYFGAIDLITGLRKELVATPDAAVVVVASNSITCQPGWPVSLAKTCLTGNEAKARAAARQTSAVQAYPASKAALAYWVRQNGVKRRWIGAGIRMNAVAPGKVTTAMTAQVGRDPLLGKFLDKFPNALNRDGKLAEIAEVINFLLSPASSLMVGSVVYADGGTDAMQRRIFPRPKAGNKVAAKAISIGFNAASKRFK